MLASVATVGQILRYVQHDRYGGRPSITGEKYVGILRHHGKEPKSMCTSCRQQVHMFQLVEAGNL